MIDASSRASPRRRLCSRSLAARVLASFVAAIAVALLAPFVHPVAFALVCSAQGSKLIVQGDVDADHGAGPSSGDDHAAHCPLCMPMGAPPSTIVPDFTPPQVLAFVQQSIPAARLASLVGAPLPARGPPVLS